MMRKSILVAAALAALGGTAGAVERPCPQGQTWDMNRGQCVEKKKVKHRSPEEKYYEALDQLDGRAAHPDPKKAVALLTDACDAKLGVACTQLGFVHLRGRSGIAPDPSKAIAFYEKACTLGDLDGCVGAADMYASGVLGQIDPAKAIKPLTKACDGGSGRGCYGLAQKYRDALGVAQDDQKASSLFNKAFALLQGECSNKDGASCDLVGVMYRDGTGVASADSAQAVTFFQKGCTAGAGDACYHLGIAEEGGLVAGADAQAAFTLLQDTCQKYDTADACFEAGAMLVLGQVQGDDKILKPFAERACTLSQTRCDLLAYIDQLGRGVPEDQAASFHWYQVACDQGNGVACRNVGDKLQNGQGTAASVKDAVVYWEKACQLQETLGCSDAGQAYFRGDDASGLTADPSRAYELFNTGCVRSDHLSCQWAGELLTNGTDGSGNPQPQKAISYFEEGCTLGRGQSCAWAGDLYADGRATGTPDPYKAAEAYQQSCWATVETSAYGCGKAAEALKTGTGATLDLTAAARAETVICKLQGGDDCITADQLLSQAQADDTAKQALVEAMTTACTADPKVESACVAYALLEQVGGYAITKDTKDAVAELDASCQRGFLNACWNEGKTYENGTGVVPDAQQAKTLYTKACDGGYTDGCFALGQLLDASGDIKDALALYTRSCDEGHGSACNMLGFMDYTAKGVKWDVAAAAQLYQKGCDLGDSVACSNLAETYDYGITRDPDPKQAYTLYQKACTMGFAGACGRAGKYLEAGTGGATKDLDAAQKAYQAGCDADMPDACVRLADLLASTKKGSPSQIAQLQQRAFDRAKDEAKTNPYYQWVLGTFHRDGMATVKDAKAAADLFAQACDGDDPLGCLDAGKLYLVGGVGLPKNLELAKVQLGKACAWIAEACTLQQKGGVPVPTPAKKGGCACDAGGDGPGGALVFLGVVGVALRRRRGSRT